MVSGLVNQLASLRSVLAFVVPACIATGGLYYMQRHHYPLGHTIKNEWYDASEELMNSMPRQGSPTPVRMNPFSERINMHSITS